jgi:hypothetical protein
MNANQKNAHVPCNAIAFLTDRYSLQRLQKEKNFGTQDF